MVWIKGGEAVLENRKITEGKQREMFVYRCDFLTGSYWRPLEVIMVSAKSRMSAPTSAMCKIKKIQLHI